MKSLARLLVKKIELYKDFNFIEISKNCYEALEDGFIVCTNPSDKEGSDITLAVPKGGFIVVTAINQLCELKIVEIFSDIK